MRVAYLLTAHPFAFEKEEVALCWESRSLTGGTETSLAELVLHHSNIFFPNVLYSLLYGFLLSFWYCLVSTFPIFHAVPVAHSLFSSLHSPIFFFFVVVTLVFFFFQQRGVSFGFFCSLSAVFMVAKRRGRRRESTRHSSRVR